MNITFHGHFTSFWSGYSAKDGSVSPQFIRDFDFDNQYGRVLHGTEVLFPKVS